MAAARLFAALLVGALLQTTVAPNIRILGANPDFALILVCCVALLRGAEVGAVFGFLIGTFVSVVLVEPLGLNSLVFIVVGYLVGRYAETADLSSSLAPLVAVFMASLIGMTMLTVAQFLLGKQVPVAFALTHIILPSVVLNALLATPLYLLVRLWLPKGVTRDGAGPR
jgi:rod shape-determining protein MreD